MFSRLRNTARILSYRERRERPEFTPEIEFVEHREQQASKISERIGALVGTLLGCVIVGILAQLASRAIGKHYSEASLLTVAGILGAVMFWSLERFTYGVRDFLAKHFKVILAPHLGHKIEETYRILRG
jgi:predicted lipid-binding transport protein (Tim44 family)